MTCHPARVSIAERLLKRMPGLKAAFRYFDDHKEVNDRAFYVLNNKPINEPFGEETL